MIHSAMAAFLTLGVFSVAVQAQQATTQQEQTPAPTDKKTRVYITDSQSWETKGAWAMKGESHTSGSLVNGTGSINGSGSVAGGGYEAGGARPQNAEIVKTFNQRCPEVTVTRNIEKADYVVTLDHEGGKEGLHKKNKVAVYNHDGDAIFSNSTITLGGSVQGACEAIRKDAGTPTRAKPIKSQ